MKFLVIAFLWLTSIDLPEICSSVAEKGSIQYAQNLSEIHNGEKWGWHSGKIGIGEASSTLPSYNKITYSIQNIYDLNLKTAWIEGEDGFGLGQSFAFTLSHFPSNDPYEFNGTIEVFNGYCKSEKSWKDNSRAKKLKIYLNEDQLGFLTIHDTWQYQTADLTKLFERDNRRIKVCNGDKLRFEIIEVYKGDKYQDVAISEFVFIGAPN